MATITEPGASNPTGRALAVSLRQVLHLVASASSQWSFRVNGGGWTTISTATEIFWTTPTSVTNRFTFDQIDLAIGSNPDIPEDTRTLNLCEGPAAVLVATASIRNEAMEEPPARPWEGEDDDPSHSVPLAMLGANRDRVGTVLLETVAEQGGPANLLAAAGPGLFVDTAGKVGCRTPFTNDVRGFGPFPAIAAYHHGGLYFHHDFGKSRTLGLTRVLYQDAGGHVAVVRGDGRRNTYRSLGGGAFTPAAALRNTLSSSGGIFTETTPSGRVYRYSSTGALDRVIDRAGNAVYYRYDANSRLQKIEGTTAAALGLVPYLSYNASGLLERLVLEDSTTPANSRTSYLQYDANRNLTRIIGPESCITDFAYTVDTARLASVTDADGYVWRAAYDGNDRVDRVVDALNVSAYFAFDTATAVARHKDRATNVTYFRHTAWGSPDRVYDLGTPADYFVFDGDGNLTRSKNRLGNEWVYEYDAVSSRIAATDPLGAKNYFAYDSQDLLRRHIDRVNRTTYLDYDGTRNRTKTIDPIGNTTYFEYEATGLLRYRKDRRGAFTYFAWDARATLSKVNDPLGHTTYFAYNTANETTAQVNPLGRITYLEHDKRGRVTKQTNPIGAAAYFAYDSRCNLVSQTDALLRTTVHVYDGNSNRTRTIDALGNTSYLTYDVEERVASQANARDFATTFTYDVLGRRQKTTDALGFQTYFVYDDAHELERQVDARGNAAYFRYDTAGRLTHQKDQLTNETYLGFDLAGQRVLTTDPRGKSTIFQYDPRGWQRRTQSAIGAVTYVVFDEEGNRLRQVDPLGKTTYSTYDLAGRLTHSMDQLLGVTYTGYDRASQTVLRTDELGVPSYMSYDDAGRSQTTRSPAGLLTYTAYDLVGNVSFTNVDQGWGNQPWGSSPWGGERATTYHAYDATNRRQKTTDAYAGVTYMAYDRVGNVDFTVDARGFGTYHTYDALNRRTHTKDGVHFAQTYMGFDQVGNVVRQIDQQGVATYLTYDAVNRVQFSVDPAGALTYHVFDQAGNRTEAHVLLGAGGERRSTYMQYDDVNRTIKRIAADTGQTYMEYDLAGNQVRAVDPVGRPTYLAYDELNRQSTRKNAFLDTRTTTYDARSSALRQIDPVGRTAYLGYDRARRLLHQSNALGEYSYFFYDARGARTHVVNPRGNSTYLRYDLLGRQTHTIDALGGVSYMGYDAVGNQVLGLDPLGNPTYMTYDGLSRTTHVKDALMAVSYMGYDSRSSAVLRVDADGRATYMAYDAARRLERQYFANPVETADSPIYYGYDQVGNRLYSDDRIQGLGLSYFVYDTLDRTTIKETMAGAVYYAYDLSGMKQELKDADERPNYHVYDAAGRLERLVLDNGRTAYYHHDLSGMVLTKLLPDNRVMSYFAYDVAGRLTQLTHCDDTGAPIAYFAYQRNASGTPVWIRRDGGLNQYYEYDPLNRLTLDQLNSSSAVVYGFRYAYDAASNRSIKTDTVAARATYYTNDARNLLTKEFVLQTGATNYFDHDGSRRMEVQRSSSEARYFAYDQGARPTQIRHTAASPDAIHYFSYNGAGERVRVVEGSTEAYWSYDGSKLIRERKSTDSFATFRAYRHNESAADPFGTVLEEEKNDPVLGPQKHHPAQIPPCGKTARLVYKVDDVVPAIVYYEYDAFGVVQGVSSTGGGADTAQRLQYKANSLIRLGTGPSIYLTTNGLYWAEFGTILGYMGGFTGPNRPGDGVPDAQNEPTKVGKIPLDGDPAPVRPSPNPDPGMMEAACEFSVPLPTAYGEEIDVSRFEWIQVVWKNFIDPGCPEIDPILHPPGPDGKRTLAFVDRAVRATTTTPTTTTHALVTTWPDRPATRGSLTCRVALERAFCLFSRTSRASSKTSTTLSMASLCCARTSFQSGPQKPALSASRGRGHLL